MARNIVFVVIISGVLGLFILFQGCTTTQRGYNNLDKVKTMPLGEVYPQAAKKTVSPNPLGEKMNQMIKLQEQQTRLLSSLIQTPKGRPVPATPAKKTIAAKNPMPGIFSKAAKAKKVKSKKVATITRSELNALKWRVAKNEEILSYHFPGEIVDKVVFAPASAKLCTKQLAWCEKYYKMWLNGEIDILGFKAFASLPKPKDSKLTNTMLIDQRLITIVQYFRERGVPVDTGDIRIEKGIPTNRFPVNTIGTIFCKKIKDPQEREKRRVERSKLAKKP